MVDASTIHGKYEEISLQYPAATAVQWKEGCLTFSQLNEASNQLAHWLIDRGVQPGDVVGVLLPREGFLIVSLLAIMKAGGSYLAINSSDQIDAETQYCLTVSPG